MTAWKHRNRLLSLSFSLSSCRRLTEQDDQGGMFMIEERQRHILLGLLEDASRQKQDDNACYSRWQGESVEQIAPHKFKLPPSISSHSLPDTVATPMFG